MKFKNDEYKKRVEESLPSRERGLKFDKFSCLSKCDQVAPLAGAWIEIFPKSHLIIAFFVAPLAGAWIEICICPRTAPACPVAPLAGAWIEIQDQLQQHQS